MIPSCDRCGGKYECYSPDYGDGATFKHWCCRTGREHFEKVNGYTKAMSYSDAGRDDLAERFGGDQ